MRETVEQILVAFVLAFIFRCYFLEAYVIPTGSMAPTLLGAHVAFRCPDCGHRFATNYARFGAADDLSVEPIATGVDRATGRVAPRVLPVRCPNCGYRLPRKLEGDEANDATAAATSYGDRILVLKYPYLFHPPRRWDVVVFKAPAREPRDPTRGRFVDQDHDVNYIKRLAGMPGETVMILDGDVYVAPTSAGTDPRPEDYRVASKNWVAIEGTRRLVYDNDFQPRGLTRTYANAGTTEVVDPTWNNPWQVEGAWKAAGRAFEVEGDGGVLRFTPGNAPSNRPLTDWLSFATTRHLGARPDPDLFGSDAYALDGLQIVPVSDLILEFDYDRAGGDGELVAALQKRGDTFEAALGASAVTVTRLKGDGTTAELFRGDGVGKHVRVEFAVVDGVVRLRLDGDDVFASTHEQYAPDVAALLEEHRAGTAPPMGGAYLSAQGVVGTVSHLKLGRDVRYTNGDLPSGGPLMRHGVPPGRVGRPITLGADEYFVLGDNTIMSADGRVWPGAFDLPNEELSIPAGVVPGRFVMGKAFFVYWPAGHALPFDFTGGRLRAVPDVGSMRFIR